MLHPQETVETAAEFNCDLAQRAAAEEVLQPEVDVPVHRQLPSPLPAIMQACLGPATFHSAEGEGTDADTACQCNSQCTGWSASTVALWVCS